MNFLSKTSFLGIAVGDRSVTVAEVAPVRGARDRWEARRVAEFVPPAGADAKAAGEALGQFLRSNGFAPSRAVVGVPARWLVARDREVPPATPEAAAEVLRMQAERLFSAELGDVAIDYAGAPDPLSPRNVLLMALPRQQLERVVAMVEAAGCDAVAVTPTTLALAAAGGSNASGATAGTDGLVLNVSGDAVELSAHRGGAPRLLRHLSVRGPDLASQNGSRTAAVTSLAGELRRTVATLPRADAGRAGAESGGNTLRLYDGVGLGADDADALVRQAGVGLRPGDGDLSALGLATNGAAASAGADGRFTPALALALLGAASRRADAVDFLHPKLARPKTRRFGRRGAWAVGVAVAVAVALLVMWVDVRNTEAALAATEAQLKANATDVHAARATTERVATARDWFEGRPAVLDVLRDVTQAFPDESQRVYVTTFSLYESGKGTITGRAADWGSVPAIQGRMSLNPAFADIRPSDHRTAGGTSDELSFTIEFRYPQSGAGTAAPGATASPAGAQRGGRANAKR